MDLDPLVFDRAFAKEGLPEHVRVYVSEQTPERLGALAQSLSDPTAPPIVSLKLGVRHYKAFTAEERAQLERAVQTVLGVPVSLAEDIGVAAAIRLLVLDLVR